ncbi:maleylacetate reductase [Paraburkholderia dilworthii]|uniref:maleylacetate reductase n=1 Tax=Paraburkholderia dilworthii TaxID=948106 RepID=UPI000404CC8D|nr:maleylacetate reductase [Paraburkholderia dilworthii]
MESFIYQAQPARVIFGSGTGAQLADEAQRLGLKRLLILCTPGQTALAERARQWAGERVVGIFADATMHTPVDVTERALDVVQDLRADGVVSIGGGSTIGLGKAIALRTDLPQIVLPTTYAGSEMTPILGETKDGLKTTQRSPRILPETVIYDVNLSLSLPSHISALSAFNAIAHAVEALYAPDTNPIISLMAQEGVRSLVRALPELIEAPHDPAVRSDMLYGAWLCSCCLGSTTMGLHHKLCHTLGGAFNLPHAETHTIVLPYVLEFNAPAIPDAMARLSDAMNDDDPVNTLLALERVCRIPMALKDIGMPEEGIAGAVDQLLANPYANPRPLETTALTELIERAWAGTGSQVAG